jgi:phosphatidylglycerophosphatase A
MSNSESPPNRFSPILLLATGLGFGYARIMPGTVGALWGLPLAWAITRVPAPGGLPNWAVHIAIILLLLAVGVPLCTAAATQLGGKKDPSAVVYDEIATMPIVFLFVPVAILEAHPWLWAAGFLFHRLFDILKPPPCRQLERLPAGLGIMADDVAAAVYAGATLHLLLWFMGHTA